MNSHIFSPILTHKKNFKIVGHISNGLTLQQQNKHEKNSIFRNSPILLITLILLIALIWLWLWLWHWGPSSDASFFSFPFPCTEEKKDQCTLLQKQASGEENDCTHPGFFWSETRRKMVHLRRTQTLARRRLATGSQVTFFFYFIKWSNSDLFFSLL